MSLFTLQSSILMPGALSYRAVISCQKSSEYDSLHAADMLSPPGVKRLECMLQGTPQYDSRRDNRSFHQEQLEYRQTSLSVHLVSEQSR